MLVRRTAMTSRTDESVHNPLGLDHHYRQKAQIERAAYLGDLVRTGVSHAPTLPQGAKRAFRVFGATLALAMAAFWILMLTSPPPGAASGSQLISDTEVVETTAGLSSTSLEAHTVSGPAPENPPSHMAPDGFEDR
jgi:hypothetical protein